MNSLQASFMYNQSIIQSSNLWTANSTGGSVKFCIALDLYSNAKNESDRILFHFMETVYKIEVDLTTGFSTSVDLIRTDAGDGGVDVINVNETITAYQCDDSYDILTVTPPLTQGDSLEICVETENDSAFQVGKIKDVTISQNGTKLFNYVSAFVDSYWAVTSCMAVNTTASKCKVKVQLLGEYFINAEPVDLIVEGVVKLDYLGRRRMLLAHTVEDGGVGEKNSMFNLKVPVAAQQVSTTSSTMDKEDVGDTSEEEQKESAGDHASVYGLLYGSIFVAFMVVFATNVSMKMMK